MFDSEFAANLCKSGDDRARKFAQEARWAYDAVRSHRAEIEEHLRTIARLEAEVELLEQLLMETEVYD